MTVESVRVSFVIITRNRCRDLCACLQSCQSQEYSDREIIVVDNASTDETLAMLAGSFPDVRVVALQENRGVSGGRNAGMRAATGEVCIHIDDDATFIGNDAARETMAYFASDPELACVGYTIRNATDGIEERKSIPRRDKRSVGADYRATYFCGAGFAVRRRQFLEAGEFWDVLDYGSQEIDLSYRMLERGWGIVHSARIEVSHRSVPTARPSGQWVYYNTRDRPWVAIRNLPWRCVATTILLWWAQTLWISIRRGEWGPYFRGLRDSLMGMRRAWWTRRVIGRETARQLKSLSGRYWY